MNLPYDFSTVLRMPTGKDAQNILPVVGKITAFPEERYVLSKFVIIRTAAIQMARDSAEHLNAEQFIN